MLTLLRLLRLLLFEQLLNQVTIELRVGHIRLPGKSLLIRFKGFLQFAGFGQGIALVIGRTGACSTIKGSGRRLKLFIVKQCLCSPLGVLEQCCRASRITPLQRCLTLLVAGLPKIIPAKGLSLWRHRQHCDDNGQQPATTKTKQGQRQQ